MLIHHIAIWTTDLERLKAFYVKYFQCKVSNLYVNNAKQFSSYFLSFQDGARIEIMHKPGIKGMQVEERVGFAHLAITVGDKEAVDALTCKMEEDGVKVESQPRTTGDGFYESVILDPDNNKIELTATIL